MQRRASSQQRSPLQAAGSTTGLVASITCNDGGERRPAGTAALHEEEKCDNPGSDRRDEAIKYQQFIEVKKLGWYEGVRSM